jgi:hypothetical protein
MSQRLSERWMRKVATSLRCYIVGELARGRETPEEHHRLAAEAADGDPLAQFVQAVLATAAGTEGA